MKTLEQILAAALFHAGTPVLTISRADFAQLEATVPNPGVHLERLPDGAVRVTVKTKNKREG